VIPPHTIQDEIAFYGHPNVRSNHLKSIEVTKAQTLSIRGDCIIGVKADKACSDLKSDLKKMLLKPGLVIKIEVFVGDSTFVMRAHSDTRLLLSDSHDLVIRRSNFICPRTVAISCDKAASDIPRKMTHLLRDPQVKGILKFTISES
jgi:hypothetical protein